MKLDEDPRTDQQLIQIALGAQLKSGRWHNVIRTLHMRGTPAIFNRAIELCKSKNYQRRCVGVNILAQLGTPRMWDRRKQANVILKIMKTEKNSEVLSLIGVAVEHLHDKRAIPALEKLARHPNADVRYGATFGLLGYKDQMAVRTLITLSADKDKAVRDWATFGLGSQTDQDSPAIRKALAERLSDRCMNARNEAIVGLAKRKDPRVIQLILHDLRAPGPRVYTLNAAEEFGHPIFLSELKKHKSKAKRDSYWQISLQDAIEACTPRSSKAR